MKRALIVSALGLMICVPAIAGATRPAPRAPSGPVGMVAPQYRIQARYAKRLVRAKLIKQTSHRKWSIKPVTRLGNRPLGSNMYFSAIPKGNPSMLSFDATVNPVKAKTAPRGIKRVSIRPQGCLIGPNSPLTRGLR